MAAVSGGASISLKRGARTGIRITILKKDTTNKLPIPPVDHERLPWSGQFNFRANKPQVATARTIAGGYTNALITMTTAAARYFRRCK